MSLGWTKTLGSPMTRSPIPFPPLRQNRLFSRLGFPQISSSVVVVHSSSTLSVGGPVPLDVGPKTGVTGGKVVSVCWIKDWGLKARRPLEKVVSERWSSKVREGGRH